MSLYNLTKPPEDNNYHNDITTHKNIEEGVLPYSVPIYIKTTKMGKGLILSSSSNLAVAKSRRVIHHQPINSMRNAKVNVLDSSSDKLNKDVEKLEDPQMSELDSEDFEDFNFAEAKEKLIRELELKTIAESTRRRKKIILQKHKGNQHEQKREQVMRKKEEIANSLILNESFFSKAPQLLHKSSQNINSMKAANYSGYTCEYKKTKPRLRNYRVTLKCSSDLFEGYSFSQYDVYVKKEKTMQRIIIRDQLLILIDKIAYLKMNAGDKSLLKTLLENETPTRIRDLNRALEELIGMMDYLAKLLISGQIINNFRSCTDCQSDRTKT